MKKTLAYLTMLSSCNYSEIKDPYKEYACVGEVKSNSKAKSPEDLVNQAMMNYVIKCTNII